MPEPPTIQVLRTAADLHALEPQWHDLWESDAGATPFQHPAWLLPWWRQFGQPDLRAVAIWQAGALLALIPLYLLEDQGTGVRQLLMIGAGTSDYLDGIFAPACTSETVQDAVAVVLREPGWDVAYFTQLRSSSLLLRALQNLETYHCVASFAGEPCSSCAASAIAELPAKIRSDVRYFRNFAIGQGALQLRPSSASDCQHVFDLLVRFHTERWREAGEAGVLADPAVLAWHREALPRLLSVGLLRLLALELGGDPIAVLYSLIDPRSRGERTQYFYLMGFSLAHAKMRPGVLLTALAFEQAASEGVRTIDMLRGQEAYKQFWRVKPVRTHGCAVQRQDFVGQARHQAPITSANGQDCPETAGKPLEVCR